MTVLRRRWAALTVRGGDRGAGMTIASILLAMVLVLVLGFTWIAGLHVRGATRAERVAVEAARAGLQAYRPQGTAAGGDPSAAVAAAERYLTQANFDGTLTGRAYMIGPGELRVAVQVRTPAPAGLSDLTATGGGYADLINSVTGDEETP